MPYASIALEPAATVLNYGQGLFEGLKAQRQASGRVVIFRPDKNHERCNSGCKRLLMPELPKVTVTVFFFFFLPPPLTRRAGGFLRRSATDHACQR